MEIDLLRIGIMSRPENNFAQLKIRETEGRTYDRSRREQPFKHQPQNDLKWAFAAIPEPPERMAAFERGPNALNDR